MSTKPLRAALYVRVSTDGQTTANQERVLRQVADRKGWEIIETFQDAGISGAKGRDKRPGFDAMLKAATRSRFDVLMVWSIDRIGRSTAMVAGVLDDLSSAGIALYCDKEAMDATTPHGKAMLHMAAVFAELERGMIRERVKAGMDRARANGATFGRPKVSSGIEAAIRDGLAAGTGMVKLAGQLGVGVSVVQRVKQTQAA